jgi:hypothetical protein
MPTKLVAVRRWQIGLAFAGVVVAAVVAVWALQRSTDAKVSANRAVAVDAVRRAEIATARAEINTEVQRRIVAARREQLKALHDQDVRSCRSRHILFQALDSTQRQGLAQTRALLRHPPPGIPASLLRSSIALNEKFLRKLKAADCTHVPPLPATPPVRP